MTKFLMIRHGESEANLKRVFAGHYNAPLTDLGRRQARATAEYIKQTFKVDKIYASDLDRAFCTGKATADLFGLDITPTKELREIYAGDWEGRIFDDIKEEYPDLFGKWFGDTGNVRPPNGESVEELGDRIITCIKKIGDENPDSTVVLATHATPIRVLQAIVTYGSVNAMKNVKWVSNASVTTVLYENGTLTVAEAGYDKHLSGIISELPKDI
ncbi:MAG: histidine phosphatase family protein [Clostridia bacterium]|nr:histidine phosphatase family protein [Clostridia bacterium]